MKKKGGDKTASSAASTYGFRGGEKRKYKDKYGNKRGKGEGGNKMKREQNDPGMRI